MQISVDIWTTPRPTTTSATAFGQWLPASSTDSSTFRAAQQLVAPPVPVPMISPLESAFARAHAGRRETEWERVVAEARRRGTLTAPDWQWMARQLARAEQLGFHEAESIARIVASGTQGFFPLITAFFVLRRLTTHPSDSVKGAALTAAAELSVPMAQWLASQVPHPKGPLDEIVRAIQAMAP